jgi:hypothetical protein
METKIVYNQGSISGEATTTTPFHAIPLDVRIDVMMQ